MRLNGKMPIPLVTGVLPMSRLSNLTRSLFAASNPVAHLLSLSEAELTSRGFDRDALARSFVLSQNR